MRDDSHCGISCSFVGRLFVKALGKPSEILSKLNEMAGFSPTEEIELYEVNIYFFRIHSILN
jgi:hypothetical protein